MRPTFAEIDLTAIRHNVRQIRGVLSPSTRMMAIVKANAYGHGAVEVSIAALEAGADFLGVAIPEEGAELRRAGIRVPIFVVGLFSPEQLPLIVEYDLVATISSIQGAQALAGAAESAGRNARFMVKFDTGMARIGIPPEQALPFIREVRKIPRLELFGVFTHLAMADARDKTHANRQLTLFDGVIRDILASGISLPWISAGNSAAITDLHHSHFNLVRPGIILYGVPPSPEVERLLAVRPAMALKTRVVFLKRVQAGTTVSYGCTYTTPRATCLATLPIGYADGYSRRLSNQGQVLIGGRRHPVVGRVCMDQIIVDLGPDCEITVGEEAVLFGRQGHEEVTVTELAGLAGTINYELLCAVSSRVPRVYIR